MSMRRWLWLGLVVLVLAVGLGAYGLWALMARSQKAAQEDQLLVRAWVIDDETGQSVRATVFLNGIPTLRDVDHFTIVVPPASDGFHLEVEAAGYERWGLRFRYKLKEGYLFKGPIRLRPKR